MYNIFSYIGTHGYQKHIWHPETWVSTVQVLGNEPKSSGGETSLFNSSPIIASPYWAPSFGEVVEPLESGGSYE